MTERFGLSAWCVEIDVFDVDKLSGGEGEKRQAFLALWRERKGSEATYSKLLSALLNTDCREDAEWVCKLLTQS